MVIPQNSKELYEMMLQSPDLCGAFELLSDDGNIVWNLYDDIRIELGVDPHDCYLGVSKMLFGKVDCRPLQPDHLASSEPVVSSKENRGQYKINI